MTRTTKAAGVGGSRRLEWIGAVVLLVGVLLFYVAVTHNIPLLGGESGQVVTARFAQANEVNDQTPVRVGGVNVGHVQTLKPGASHTTMIGMRITQSGISLHRDASARIAWRTLLGGSMYIDLDPGSPSAPALRGPIPLSSTSSQVDWDQLLSEYPGSTRQALRGTLKGLSQSLTAPAQTDRAIGTLGPSLAAVGQATQALRGQDIGDLPSLVSTAGRTLSALSSDTNGLQDLVDGAARTLAVTAADHVALEQTLQLAPPALDSTTLTMQRLNQTLTRLDPLVTELLPGVREIAPTTALLHPLLDQASTTLVDAVPLLHAAPPALGALHAMSAGGVPLVNSLVPTVDRLNTKLIPFLGSRDSDTGLRTYEAIGPFVSDVSSAAQQFDGSANMLHFEVEAGTETLLPCDPGLDLQQLSRCDSLNDVLGIVFGGRKP